MPNPKFLRPGTKAGRRVHTAAGGGTGARLHGPGASRRGRGAAATGGGRDPAWRGARGPKPEVMGPNLVAWACGATTRATNKERAERVGAKKNSER